jgi:hypothetical protein
LPPDLKTVLAMLFLLVFPGTTFANAGFPVFFLFFDHVLLLAIPLVALEAVIARRVLKEPWRLLMFHNPLGAPRMVPADRPKSGRKTARAIAGAQVVSKRRINLQAPRFP